MPIAFLLASEGPNGKIIPADFNEVIWSSLAFLLVVGLIVWKGGPAIKNMWNARIDRLKGELETAEAARTNAESALAAVESSIANADEERTRLLAEARETAENVKTQLVARAGTDAADVRSRGAADIEASKAQATGDLQAEIGTLAVGAAEAVISNTLDEATQRDLIDSYIDRVGTGA